MNNRISLSVIDFQEKYGDKGAIDAAAKLGLSIIDFDLSTHHVDKDGDIYSLGKDGVKEYFA